MFENVWSKFTIARALRGATSPLSRVFVMYNDELGGGQLKYFLCSSPITYLGKISILTIVINVIIFFKGVETTN